MNDKSIKLSKIGLTPKGFTNSHLYQYIETSLIKAFNLEEILGECKIELSKSVKLKLAAKIAALKWDQVENKRADAPYISIWEKGAEKEIEMVYINPAIETITGFTSQEVLSTGFNIFVPDDIITKISVDENGVLEENIPIEKEQVARQQHSLDNWDRIYEIITKSGTAFVKDVAIVEYFDGVAISTGTLIDVTPEMKFRQELQKR